MEEATKMAEYYIKQIQTEKTMREAVGLLRVLVEMEREKISPMEQVINKKSNG